jgi:hypothetical protein
VSKAENREASVAATPTKKAPAATEDKKAADAKETPKGQIEPEQASAKQSPKKHDKQTKEDGGANWQQLVLPLGFFLLVLVLLLLLIIALVQVLSAKKQLRVLSASLKRDLDELRAGLQLLPKQVAQILDRRIEERGIAERDEPPSPRTPSSSMTEATRSIRVSMQALEAKSVIAAFLAAASEVHPIGGVIRVRLDTIARMANCSTIEVRSVLASANSAYGSCGHPILRRQNFLSVVESRSDTPGESPYVAAISHEALQAMRENTPN